MLGIVQVIVGLPGTDWVHFLVNCILRTTQGQELAKNSELAKICSNYPKY